MKKIVTNIAVLFISLIAGFLICELLVRVIPLQRFDKTQFGLFRPHLTRGFAFIPNVSKTRWEQVDWNINSRGFRDYEHQFVKERFRILGLGDSYFIGHEVSFENSFLRQLEKSLKIEVIKLAVTNYGTIQERILLEEEGRLYNPDVVLLGVYVGNDLGNNADFPHTWCVDGGYLARCGDRAYLGSKLVRFSAKYSLFARFFLQRANNLFPQKPMDNESQKSGKQEPLFKNGNRENEIYQTRWPVRLMEGYRLLEENVLKLNSSVRKNQSELIVVIIPTETQIYDWQWQEYLKRFASDESDFDRYKVINLFSDFLKEKEIRHIDLLPMLKKAAETDANLHQDHWHWSVNANKLVADTVENYLKQHKLIPLEQAPEW